MVDKVLTITKVHRGVNSISRRGGVSGSTVYKAKNGRDVVPEDVLGKILVKFYGVTKELQADMCIKHIETWKDLMLEAEIPARQEKCKDDGASMSLVASYIASQRNPMVGSVNLNVMSSSSGIVRPVLAHSTRIQN